MGIKFLSVKKISTHVHYSFSVFVSGRKGHQRMRAKMLPHLESPLVPSSARVGSSLPLASSTEVVRAKSLMFPSEKDFLTPEAGVAEEERGGLVPAFRLSYMLLASTVPENQALTVVPIYIYLHLV
jgi:hypothetical protein